MSEHYGDSLLTDGALRTIQRLEAVIAEQKEQLAEANILYYSTVHELAECKKDAAHKQSKIDELMLEYCPEEMTDDQKVEWLKHQMAIVEKQNAET